MGTAQSARLGWVQRSDSNNADWAAIRDSFSDESRCPSGYARRSCLGRILRRVSAMHIPETIRLMSSIVKLWDIRFPAPSPRTLDPRPTCMPFGELPDPTLIGKSPSRRPRSINSLVECPVTGDLYALTGDSKIHTLRPSAYTSVSNDLIHPEAIQPGCFTDPHMLVSSFYIRLAISSDGKYLASGSCRGGIMTWDTTPRQTGQPRATRLSMGVGGIACPDGREREVSAVDWGKDLVGSTSRYR